MSDDDVTDYLVMEAVAMKVNKEDQEAHERAEREAWKNKHHELRERLER